MIETADVIIVGGGVTALNTAISLKQSGVEKVVVLERHTVGAGQSGRAAGVIRGTVQHPTVSATQLAGQSFFSEFTAQTGISLDVQRVGYLLIGQAQQREYVERTATVARQAGCVVHTIDAKEAASRQPGLNAPRDGIYLYEPGALYVDPMPATHALMLAALKMGVNIVEDCEVGAIRIQGEQVVGVDTAAGRIDADRLLLATSVWGQPQLSALGIDLPVRPHIAQMAFFHVPPGSPSNLETIVFDARANLYMRPEHDRQLFVGRKESEYYGSNEDPVNPDNYRQTATHAALCEMRRRLAISLPFMKNGFVHRSYACTYDVTPDEMPILDKAPGIDGLFFALGFSGGGFSMSPWVGRQMAALVLSGLAPQELRLFGLQRFASGDLIQWSNTPV